MGELWPADAKGRCFRNVELTNRLTLQRRRESDSPPAPPTSELKLTTEDVKMLQEMGIKA